VQQSAPSPDFFCETRPDRELALVRVAGELDFGAAPQLAAAVDELLDVGHARIVIDLRALEFLDSAGVHTLLSAHAAAQRRGAALRLVRGSSRVHRVFELTATDSLLSFDAAGADA
jgi:anti-sigma B factor antagonist